MGNEGKSLLVGEIAKHLDGKLIGEPDVQVSQIGSLDNAGPGEIVFVLAKKYLAKAKKTKAEVVITFQEIEGITNQIIVKNPRKALAQTISLFFDEEAIEWLISEKADIHKKADIPKKVFIGPFSIIGANTKIGEGTRIFGNVSIAENCIIGKNCIIHPGVVLYKRVEIGNNVILHAGTVIGIDGMGYYQEGKTWKRIPHIGKVIIKDNVEIGANNCIDRGCLGNTFIDEGCKIDNLNHFAHNTVLGKNCAMAAHIAFAGSVELGDNVVIGGQAGFQGHIKIGNNAQVLARAGVTKDIPENSIISGFPAQKHEKEQRQQAALRKLAKIKK